MTDTVSTEKNKSGLSRKDFQRDIAGKPTDLYILKNKRGMEMAVTNYGCAILSIMVPDKDGNYANVVLGHDSIEHVIHSPEPFLSTTIGRYGNRIAQGKFRLNGQEYDLAVNNGPNSLHGGPTGFHTRIWDACQPDDGTVIFRYTSADGEEGFPGELQVEMSYQLLENDNLLAIRYHATTNKPTLVNLTNHAFFNLSGIAHPTPSVLNHTLYLNADHYLPIDEVSIPTGEIATVRGTPFDFNESHTLPLGQRIDQPHPQLMNGAGYDHCYVLNKENTRENCTLAAICTDPRSGRTLTVYTTEPGLQLYTGNWLNGFTGAHGASFPARSAVCFEAQRFPDTPHRSYFPSALLNPGQEYTQLTMYQFGISL
ncbi:MAG: galactose mutarotase [Prevotellaceae bacterium]|jgi:aldose 1-epimerase|nr:galactose mutarotase [Prevotellaceae bacterium]